MELKKEKNLLIPTEAIGLLTNAYVEDQMGHFSLHQVSMEQIVRARAQEAQKTDSPILSMPHMIALDYQGHLHLYPAADKDYEVGIYYHPPIKKM